MKENAVSNAASNALSMSIDSCISLSIVHCPLSIALREGYAVVEPSTIASRDDTVSDDCNER
jgi:hypothetical protein